MPDPTTVPDPTAVPDAARCRRCGYPLRGLLTPACPECGRAFDPADPATMSVGRRPGPLARLTLRPTGWPLAAAAVVAAVLVAAATRWPAGGVPRSLADLPYYFPGGRLHRESLLSLTDWAYVAGLLVAVATLLVWVVRSTVRPWLRRRYGPSPTPPATPGRRAALAALAAVATAMVAGGQWVGSPYRLAKLWALRLLDDLRSNPVYIYGPTPPIAGLSNAEEVAILRTGLGRLSDRRERLACLRLLYERQPSAALSVVLDQLARERDPAMRVTLVHLIGLHGVLATLPQLLPLWDNPDAAVRAAVTDAVGMIRGRSYPVPNEGAELASLGTDPAILLPQDLSTIRPPTGDLATTPAEVDARTGALRLAALRPRFFDRMVGGATDAERQAAARALLPWSADGYRLRVAEWGVWAADLSGKLTLMQSAIDEIPPFVHRTGDSLASMAPRFTTGFAVLKPILHVTADRPMSIDVPVVIAHGRPWFAYPEPDDYTLAAYSPGGGGPDRASPIANLERPGLPSLADPGEGYPWVDPPHRLHATWGPTEIAALGLRWQSVIVSPKRLPWMAPPAVPADPKFAWWDRLRQVDCSWVSSRGEADRFLYYDGPTRAVPPVTVSRQGDQLRFRHQPIAAPPDPKEPTPPRSFDPLATMRTGLRCGLFIAVRGQDVRASTVERIDAVDHFDLATHPPLMSESPVAAALLSMLTVADLTADEAAGLVDCWRPQLFRTDGSRFLLLMTPADYDALCPIRVDPPPTELVRVGLVLTEFGTTGDAAKG